MTTPTPQSNRQLAVAISAAALVAIVTFLALILPAEFGRDPLGTGQLLGLSRLADTRAASLNSQPVVHRVDEVEFVLEPFQSLEYKYLLDKDSALIFSWQADGNLYVDMHADDITREDYFESYQQDTVSEGSGVYVAAFNGMHGWYWENREFQTVTLRLQSAGYYVSATEYRAGGSMDRTPPPALE